MNGQRKEMCRDEETAEKNYLPFVLLLELDFTFHFYGILFLLLLFFFHHHLYLHFFFLSVLFSFFQFCVSCFVSSTISISVYCTFLASFHSVSYDVWFLFGMCKIWLRYLKKTVVVWELDCLDRRDWFEWMLG